MTQFIDTLVGIFQSSGFARFGEPGGYLYAIMICVGCFLLYLAIVKEFPGVRGVFHCYSGSLEDAKTLIRLGWNLSFTGSVTYKNAKKAPEVLAWIPEDRFMIETDAPYMLPYPRVKGEKRNDSSKLPRIAAKIAAIRGLTEEEVERISTENGIRFFGLDQPVPVSD